MSSSWIMLALAVTLAPPDTAPIVVTRAVTAPTIDGVLSDPGWSRATVVTDFVQRTPTDGAPSTQRTEVLLLYTPSTLFVGLRAFDEQPDRIVATVMRRDDDALLENDQFAMAIDSYADGRNGFWFSTNALGARLDYQFFDEGTRWIDWDGDWRARAQRTSDGWTAELAIPFAALRFRSDSVVVMGMNFFRRIIRTNEQTFAPHIPREFSQGTATVSKALRFAFEGIGGNTLGYVRPYGLAGVQRQDPLGAVSSTSSEVDMGADLRLNLTDNVTATLSYNTDFAQVEVDDRQINLTRFDLFFPEKREFFLEDGGLFSFGVSQEAEVFFSRRIGLAADSAGGLVTVPILLGGKLVARTGPFEMAALNVLTRSGARPATNHGAFRIKAGVAPRSYVGGIVTTTHASGLADGAVGADVVLYANPVTGARAIAATRWGRSGAAWRESSLLAGEVFRTGSRLEVTLGVLEVGAAFLPPTGFIARPGTRRFTAEVATPWYPTGGFTRRIAPAVAYREYREIGEGLQSRTASVSTVVDLRTDDQLSAGVTASTEVVDGAFEIFRDRVVQPGEYDALEGWVQVTSKPGRLFSATARASYGGLFGARKSELELGSNWKLDRHVTLAPSVRVASVPALDGGFTAYQTRLRGDFALDTRAAVIAIAQYDNDTRRLGINLRAVYQFREGTEIFLVFNHLADGPRLDGPLLGTRRQQGVLLKVTYRLNIG